jgi:hypothetical protein
VGGRASPGGLRSELKSTNLQMGRQQQQHLGFVFFFFFFKPKQQQQ